MRPLLAWLVLAAVAAVSIGLSRPPPPRGADAPAAVFSAGRAFPHVERVAARPHPVRSAANAAVRAYLTTQLEHLGLEVEVRRQPSRVFPWPLHNVLAKRAGRASTGVVLVACHYDAATRAPGAGDDGAAVAAVLETARLLSVAEPLQNDVWFLLTDGEEAGLLGARAFADAGGLEDVDVVINFEARGTAGRSLMFQTSPGSRSLVTLYGGACPRPSACSLMDAFYRRMPNDTDFTVFLEHGVPGLNVAFIEGYTRYHTPADTPENLSRASLQHHGETMWSLVRALGARDLRRLDHEEEAVYFDVLGRLFVLYPAGWAWPLTCGTVVLLALAVWLAGRRGAFPTGVKGVGAGALAVLRAMAYAAVVVGAAGYGAIRLLEPFPGPVKGGAGDGWVFAGLALAILGVASAAMGRVSARHGDAAALAGALAVLAALLVASSVWLVGGTFLFLWPLLFVLAAWCATLRLRSPAFATGLALLYAVPVVVLLAPLGHLLFVGMGLERSIFHAPVLGLGAATLVPLFDRAGGGWRRPVVWLPLLLAVLAVALGLGLSA